MAHFQDYYRCRVICNLNVSMTQFQWRSSCLFKSPSPDNGIDILSVTCAGTQRSNMLMLSVVAASPNNTFSLIQEQLN
jgi:hypothetical protein